MVSCMDEKITAELKNQLKGEVILPGDESYERARKVYNAMIDRRPAAIVRCKDVADVIASVKAARALNLNIAIRGGGHSAAGFGTADGALVVDLGLMKGIRVDPGSKTARAEGGCTWGDFNHATYSFGLATTGGPISTVGLGGLTLGGGIGHLTRRAGLTADNLVSADVVLADGSFRVANERENPDLFWALRGGGGNFGVVTNFQYRLHDIKDVVGGTMYFEVVDAPNVMQTYDEYISNAPRELGAFFGWQIALDSPFVPKDRHGDVFCEIVVCWTGRPEESKKVFAPLYDAAPVVAQSIRLMPYPVLNSAFDSLRPPGLLHYWKGLFAKRLTEGAVEAHMRYGPKIPTVNSITHIYPINGAVHDRAPDSTAFGHRDAKYAIVIGGMWTDQAKSELNIRWVQDFHKALEPHSDQGAFINFLSGDDLDKAAINFGSNYERLRSVKAKYDPDNVFRFNPNISPIPTYSPP